jgi:hypothetical protein
VDPGTIDPPGAVADGSEAGPRAVFVCPAQNERTSDPCSPSGEATDQRIAGSNEAGRAGLVDRRPSDRAAP